VDLQGSTPAADEEGGEASGGLNKEATDQLISWLSATLSGRASKVNRRLLFFCCTAKHRPALTSPKFFIYMVSTGFFTHFF